MRQKISNRKPKTNIRIPPNNEARASSYSMWGCVKSQNKAVGIKFLVVFEGGRIKHGYSSYIISKVGESFGLQLFTPSVGFANYRLWVKIQH